ncbi:MAG: pilus assembly protein PilM, partial [Planctomycetes bacterium]|nr:pilus assembly protein PilM [Planctomycetota bacterium]
PASGLDSGGRHTQLILGDGKKFWIRALPHSGNEISKSIMSRLKLGFAEAEKLKVDAAKNPQHAARLFTAIIQPKLKDLVNQIQQSVGFYRSQVGEAQFKNVYLLGNASRVVGMKKYLEEHMGLPVHRVQTINHLRINRDVDVQVLQANLPAFGTAFGCALQGVGASDCTVDLIPQEEKLEKEYQRKKIHVFVALAILFVVTGLSGFIVRTKIEQANRVTAATAGFVRPYRRFDKSIREIEELNIDAQVKILQETAELRNRPFRGLRMLGEILADLPLAETVLEKVTLGTNGGNKEKVRSTVTQKMTDLLNQKLWITSLRADKVFWPEKVEKKSGDKRRSRGKKSGDDRVLAFKFTVFAMVVQQENASASREFIRERLQAPLEQKLKASELTLDSKVRLSPGFQESRPVLLPKEHAKQGAGPAFQKGGPFFGVELTWYMRDREPPKAETEEEKKK